MRRFALFLPLLLIACEPGAPGASEPPPETTEVQQALASPDAFALLDPASQKAVAESPVPVLLFPAEWSADSTVMAGRGFYAVSARRGEHTLSIHATDIVHAPGDGIEAPPREHQVRGKPALVMVNDGIRSVTWEEGRTGYVVEVECYRALEDPRCTEEDFVLELAERLVEVKR